jgi:hypothetical protein
VRDRSRRSSCHARGVSSADRQPSGVLIAWRSDAGPGTQVELAWDANREPDIAGYQLYRDDAPGVAVLPATQIGSTDLTTTSFIDRAPGESGTWHYVVTAVDTSGNESPPPTRSRSCSMTAHPSASPVPPAGRAA